MHNIAMPPAAWSKKASLFVDWAADQLWLDQSREFMNCLYCLQVFNGLTEETIRTNRLGWNPVDYWREPAEWGLSNDLNWKINLPSGLVIPYFAKAVGTRQNTLVSVRIRQQSPEGHDHYRLVAGSSISPMILEGNEEVFVIVESELDAILLHQIIGDRAGIIATGIAQFRPDSLITDILQNARLILVALDVDVSEWWLEHFDQARRWPPTDGINLCEMWHNYANLMSLIDAGIEKYLLPRSDTRQTDQDSHNTTSGEGLESKQTEIEKQISDLEQRILTSLKDRDLPIRVTEYCLIHDITQFARGTAHRIITGGKYGELARVDLWLLGIEITE